MWTIRGAVAKLLTIVAGTRERSSARRDAERGVGDWRAGVARESRTIVRERGRGGVGGDGGTRLSVGRRLREGSQRWGERGNGS